MYWCTNGGLPFFYYFTVWSHLLCVYGKSDVSLLRFGSSVFIVLIPVFCTKPLHHFIFPIHFDSVPAMLTVLFKLVWNIQKRCKDNFLSTKPRHFLLLKMMNNITRSLNIIAILTKNKDQKQLSKKLFLILVVVFFGQNCSCFSFWWYC